MFVTLCQTIIAKILFKTVLCDGISQQTVRKPATSSVYAGPKITGIINKSISNILRLYSIFVVLHITRSLKSTDVALKYYDEYDHLLGND
jgi:hypothetical protein